MSNDNNFARGQRSESGEKIKVPPGGQGSLSPPKMLFTHSLTKKKNDALLIDKLIIIKYYTV